MSGLKLLKISKVCVGMKDFFCNFPLFKFDYMKKINLANSPHSDVTGLENVNKKIDLSIGVWVKDISQTCGQLIGQVKLITEFPQAFSFTFFFPFLFS